MYLVTSLLRNFFIRDRSLSHPLNRVIRVISGCTEVIVCVYCRLLAHHGLWSCLGAFKYWQQLALNGVGYRGLPQLRPAEPFVYAKKDYFESTR